MKYTVTGNLFGETARYADWDSTKEFPRYESVTSHEWAVEADSLEEAEKWLARNYPEMYMGGGVVSEDGQSFVFIPVPGNYWPQGSYETLAARIGFVTAKIA